MVFFPISKITSLPLWSQQLIQKISLKLQSRCLSQFHTPISVDCTIALWHFLLICTLSISPKSEPIVWKRYLTVWQSQNNGWRSEICLLLTHRKRLLRFFFSFSGSRTLICYISIKFSNFFWLEPSREIVLGSEGFFYEFGLWKENF